MVLFGMVFQFMLFLPLNDVQSDNYTPFNRKYEQYPASFSGAFEKLEWISDDVVRIIGLIDPISHPGVNFSFFVTVPGDLEYEQPLLEIQPNGRFEVLASIGRPKKDYDREFVVKLVKRLEGRRVAELIHVITKVKNPEPVQDLKRALSTAPPVKYEGFQQWVEIQQVPSEFSDNPVIKFKGGLLVKNYRFLSYNPDEPYLSRYGRITLYGSSTLAKALILMGELDKARQVLNIWLALMDDHGRIPRSANTIGDNFINHDIRSGDMAHFLGALALMKAATGETEYDPSIFKIIDNYFIPQQDGMTGLVRGGFNSRSTGYGPAGGYMPVNWASAEHNFDLFQALVLLSQLYEQEIAQKFITFYREIGRGIDRYLWDDKEGTFDRGYRFDSAHDRARALDCSSWGVLYLLKQSKLVSKEEIGLKNLYINRARRSLHYLEKNFATEWCYQTPDGRKGCIRGFRPYAGTIEDLRSESEKKPIDWDRLSDMVWSEGTLGVAMAYDAWWKITGEPSAQKRFQDILGEMVRLQSLSDRGGVLYSSKRIEGHFTTGEELASLGWLGYALLAAKGEIPTALEKFKDYIPW
jgi:hypothetical protein